MNSMCSHSKELIWWSRGNRILKGVRCHWNTLELAEIYLSQCADQEINISVEDRKENSQGDTAMSRDPKSALFEDLQNRVHYH